MWWSKVLRMKKLSHRSKMYRRKTERRMLIRSWNRCLFFLKKFCDKLLNHIPHGGVRKLIIGLSHPFNLPESIRRTDHVLSLLVCPATKASFYLEAGGPLLRPPQGPLRGAAKRSRRRQRPDVQHLPPRQPLPHEPRLGSRRIRSGDSRALPDDHLHGVAVQRVADATTRSLKRTEKKRRSIKKKRRIRGRPTLQLAYFLYTFYWQIRKRGWSKKNKIQIYPGNYAMPYWESMTFLALIV